MNVFEAPQQTPRQRAEDIVRRFPGIEKHFDAVELTDFIERAIAAAVKYWAYQPAHEVDEFYRDEPETP